MTRYIRPSHHLLPLIGLCVYCAVASLLVLVSSSTAAYAGSDTFLKSDDYHDSDEVVGKFLHDDDYRLIVEDIERNDVSFDWGWVAQPAPPAQPQVSGRRHWWNRRHHSGPDPAEPKQLAFDIHSFKTIYVPPVPNISGDISPGLSEKVHKDFVLAAQQMGLTVVPKSDSPDLELAGAIVKLKREPTYAYVATIEPFIKLEVKLTDLENGKTLLLIRNRRHSNSPADAALNFASDIVKFLR